MTVKQLGNETTTVYADGAEFVMERIFDAPRELVWAALTDAAREVRERRRHGLACAPGFAGAVNAPPSTAPDTHPGLSFRTR